MIKRFLCCFSVVLAFSAPVARVYADPTVEEAILQAVSNALYQTVYDDFGNEISQGVLLPENGSWDDRTIWQLLRDIELSVYNILGDSTGSLNRNVLWEILQDLGYGSIIVDSDYNSYFEFSDGKTLSDVVSDSNVLQRLASVIAQQNLDVLMSWYGAPYSNSANMFQLFGSLALSSGGFGGGDGGVGEFPTQVKIDIKNILENSITNNVAVSNILDVLTNPNSRQTNVLNVSLTNISHYASNTVDIATQIRDILKEILQNQTNHNEGIDTSINWMTNNWPDSTAAPPIGGGDSSNDVWSVWIPTAGGGTSELQNYFVPNIHWERVGEFMGMDYYAPTYDALENQPDNWQNAWYNDLMGLLQDYEVGGIDGQKFVAGLLFLQSRMMGKLSTQLYMLHNKIPTKTNLWNSINEETNWVRDNAESVKTEVEGQLYQVQNLLDRADTSIISTYFPKVQTAISRLNTTSNDPVVRVPLPSFFGSGSGSEVWIVDVREIQGHDRLRKFVRWVCIIVWSIIFVRTFIVPSLVILCLCARFSDMACGLLFVDSLDGCHVIGETVGGLSEFILNLIGLDTNLKRWAVGVSTI